MTRGPIIEEWDLAEVNLESYYYSFPLSAMAIHCNISERSKRTRELEAYGYDRRPPTTGERACFAVESADGIDEVSVAAVRRGLQGNIMQDEVNDIYEAYRDCEVKDTWWISRKAGQHVHTVIAVLHYLHERGIITEELNQT